VIGGMLAAVLSRSFPYFIAMEIGSRPCMRCRDKPSLPRALKVIRKALSAGDTAPTPAGSAEKADHRAVHFRIKSGSGQRVRSGHSSEQDLPLHANERQATAYCQKTREWL